MAGIAERPGVDVPSLEEAESGQMPAGHDSRLQQDADYLGRHKKPPRTPVQPPWWQRRSAPMASYERVLRSNSNTSVSSSSGSEEGPPSKRSKWRHYLLPRMHDPKRPLAHFGGSEYTERMVFAGAWLLFLLAGYLLARLCCHLGLPSDGTDQPVVFDALTDITNLLQYGFILGWFVGAFCFDRFMWLCSRIWFPALYVITIVVYSAASNLRFFRHSLVDIDTWGAPMYILVSCAATLAVAVVAWHLWAAWFTKTRLELALYFVSRAVIFVYFGICAGLLQHSRYNKRHVHHLYIGWAIALFAEFDHCISGAVLAIGSAMFVQGIGAYSFAPIFSDSACFRTTTATSALRCDFQAASNFTISVCPGAHGAMPEYTCFS
ncbi:hypothetical protein WJX72_009952 [[Myrmecia] bisecta]|uniref:Uncharacterized protein n=1 Tax=[Myrmecia] bisecta TaxID=41462 RepID=A0AAW1PXN3_9CHLO